MRRGLRSRQLCGHRGLRVPGSGTLGNTFLLLFRLFCSGCPVLGFSRLELVSGFILPCISGGEPVAAAVEQPCRTPRGTASVGEAGGHRGSPVAHPLKPGDCWPASGVSASQGRKVPQTAKNTRWGLWWLRSLRFKSAPRLEGLLSLGGCARLRNVAMLGLQEERQDKPTHFSGVSVAANVYGPLQTWGVGSGS